MSTLQIGWFRKLAYSMGSVAYGVKDNGFSTFMMFYFNQVLGLSAIYVGLALLIAMAFDAVSDPYVGHISDRFSSRMGRRHPFMYLSMIPAVLAYVVLWSPPGGLSEMGLFLYLLAMSVLVRLTITFYEVPNSAMVAEVEPDYDKRTSLAGMRSMMGWLGGVIVAVIAYQVYLVPTAEIPKGELNGQGYRDFAVLAAIVMFVTMLISALSTHSLIDKLPKSDTDSDGHSMSFIENVKNLFANRSFRNLFLSGLFTNMVFGVSMTLQLYFGTILFGLDPKEMSVLALMMIPASIVAYPLASFVCRGREKRTAAIFFTIASIIAGNLVLLLKVLDVLPANGTSNLFLILMLNAFVGSALMIALQIVMVSMTADLVEMTAHETGHRAEGLYFATFTFTRKVVTGVGMFCSGLILTLARAQSQGGAETSLISADTMYDVALYFMPLITVMYLAAIYFLRGYKLTRGDHTKNLEAIAASH